MEGYYWRKGIRNKVWTDVNTNSYNFYSNLIIYNCKTKVAIAEALSSTCCVKSESRQSFCATAKLICTFCIPKYNVTVRFFSDFRELDKTIKTKPFPIPKQSRFLN